MIMSGARGLWDDYVWCKNYVPFTVVPNLCKELWKSNIITTDMQRYLQRYICPPLVFVDEGLYPTAIYPPLIFVDEGCCFLMSGHFPSFFLLMKGFTQQPSILLLSLLMKIVVFLCLAIFPPFFVDEGFYPTAICPYLLLSLLMKGFMPGHPPSSCLC